MSALPNIAQSGLEKTVRPVKVIQFGEGNFLRGFADYMIDILNGQGMFGGNIILLQPVPFGNIEPFYKQDCLYTVMLRGLDNGQEKVLKRVVTSVDSVISCHGNYESYAELCKLDTLRFVISNTTEAGIVFDGSDLLESTPPKSYPGKLTKFLYKRYKHFNGDINKGLIILPVELIDDNGVQLKKIVKELTMLWKLETEFDKWIDEACIFTSTLVDRIVTGYPRDEAENIFRELGYEDKLLVTGEPFALWVIESEKDISGELPFGKAGLPVIFTDNQAPYKQRKVRILNGAHTSFALAAYLGGYDYVGQALEDDLICRFMNKIIFEEVIPTLDLPEKELLSFAEAVIDRFKNPFVKHSLLSISLNSVSKWKARCLPSFLGYVERKNEVPKYLAFSLAALMAFYSGKEIRGNALVGKRNGEEYLVQDDLDVLSFFAEASDLEASELTKKFLSNKSFFGEDLTCLKDTAELISGYLQDIRTLGMGETLAKHFS